MASETTQEAKPLVGPADPMDSMERWILGVYIAIAWLLLLYLFGKFWPYDFSGGLWTNQEEEVLFSGLVTVKTSSEIRLLVLILCAGALGALVHALQSFVDFHGNRQLARSWMPWYLFRPWIGALMAFVFYLLLRGGLVTGALDATGQQTTVKVFGLVGAAALIGMFSDLAALKIKDVFTTLFAAPVKAQRADPLQPPVAKPEVTEIKPATLSVGTTNPKITVLGKNFVKETKVLVNDKERPQTYVSSEELNVQLETPDAATAVELKIVVVNPPTAGGKSDPKILTVA